MSVQGRSIRLFLVDGSPHGLLTAEIVNWTGHVLTAPRSRLADLVKRPECGRTGVYFLVGPDPDNSSRPKVYIGESDNVAVRLKQHNRPEGEGGKDFWEKVCLVTSKDQNLTKAHIKYLECQLMAMAKGSGRCSLVNGTNHQYEGLPEADLADMAFFIDQIQTLLPALGHDFLREPNTKVLQQSNPDALPQFELKVAKHKIRAKAQEHDGEFVVQAGSITKAEDRSQTGYNNLWMSLVDSGVIQLCGDGTAKFTKDYAFSSPSAAAAVVKGYNSNGRKDWVLANGGQNYGDWQQQQLESAE
ncbi:GIY-YIG nuclease family protein [Ferrimonas balearica]|uniref:GIY-YIG nuclease family protein n=1 Tax=Ferrimonas balearica TaxID=44012 RepID=UPI001C998E00|nr:GIY-YIG nuclease family protein [Ferrimonas balearica]MBY5920947.1 GIY-YIG nuclease family protein [Ferrimonas balearica]MBY5996368.1 GIY-YIG nuclease family protein [Ferrimonas balearica]